MLKLILWRINRSQKNWRKENETFWAEAGTDHESLTCAVAHQRAWWKGEDARSVRYRLFLHAS